MPAGPSIPFFDISETIYVDGSNPTVSFTASQIEAVRPLLMAGDLDASIRFFARLGFALAFQPVGGPLPHERASGRVQSARRMRVSG